MTESVTTSGFRPNVNSGCSREEKWYQTHVKSKPGSSQTVILLTELYSIWLIFLTVYLRNIAEEFIHHRVFIKIILTEIIKMSYRHAVLSLREIDFENMWCYMASFHLRAVNNY
jgi:hypothetical protein